MKASVLFVIQSDPRRSGRPVEAVRIAAGVGVWKKVDVAVYLREAAVLVLGEQAEALMDGEDYARYLPILRELGRPVYVQKGGMALGQIGQATLPFEEISNEQLAAMAADPRMRAAFLNMRRVLHILTRPDDVLARELMTRQKGTAGTEVMLVDLTLPKPDYKALLGKIFQADSVETW